MPRLQFLVARAGGFRGLGFKGSRVYVGFRGYRVLGFRV